MVEVARGNGGRFSKKYNGETQPVGEFDSAELPASVSGPTVVNPAEITGGGESAAGSETVGSEQPKRKRGRPAGFSPNKEKNDAPIHIDGISAILFSVHQMLAGMAKTPELALSEDESKKMSKAAAEVAKHYDFNATPKQMAWFNLSLCAGGIYGAKFFEYSARVKAERKAKVNTVQPEVSNNFQY